MNIGITTQRLNEAFLYLKNQGKVSTQKEIADAIGSAPPNVSRAFKGDERYLTKGFLVRFNHAFGDIFNPAWLNGEEEFKKFRDKMDTDVMPCYYNETIRSFHANGSDWPSAQDDWYKICDASFVKWNPFRIAIDPLVHDERLDASNQMVKELWLDYNFSYNNGTESEWEPPKEILKNFRGQDAPIKIEGNNDSVDYVPLLPIEAMAGSLSGFSQGVNLRDCRKIKCHVEGADWAIQISGNSMEPMYQSGSYVYIKKISGSFIPWGNIFVLDTQDGVVIKKIFPIEGRNEYIRAESINPAYPPFEIEKSCILGIYRVLGGLFINSTM